jgi:hypothetical protein
MMLASNSNDFILLLLSKNQLNCALGLPSEELLKVWFPDIITRKRPLSGTESLVSIDYARELIGFEVKYPYRLA